MAPLWNTGKTWRKKLCEKLLCNVWSSCKELSYTGFYSYRDVSAKSSLNSLFRTERYRRQLKPLMNQQAENVSKAFLPSKRHFGRHVIKNIGNRAFTGLLRTRYFRKDFADFCSDKLVLMENQANQYETWFCENISRNLRHWIRRHYKFFSIRRCLRLHREYT